MTWERQGDGAKPCPLFIVIRHNEGKVGQSGLRIDDSECVGECWKLGRAKRVRFGGRTIGYSDIKEKSAQKVFAIPGNDYAPGAGGVSRQRRKRLRW